LPIDAKSEQGGIVNRVYRLVWCVGQQIWVAASEIARGRSKSGHSKRMGRVSQTVGAVMRAKARPVLRWYMQLSVCCVASVVASHAMGDTPTQNGCGNQGNNQYLIVSYGSHSAARCSLNPTSASPPPAITVSTSFGGSELVYDYSGVNSAFSVDYSYTNYGFSTPQGTVLTVNNYQQTTLAGTADNGVEAYGIDVEATSPDISYPPSVGSSSLGVVRLVNNAQIVIDMAGTNVLQGSAIRVNMQPGYDSNNNGGNAGGVNLVNNSDANKSPIIMATSGAGGALGLDAESHGGNAKYLSDNGAWGGNSGNVSVQNSASVDVTYTWSLGGASGSNNNGVFGILTLGEGGRARGAQEGSASNTTAGQGGEGDVATVTVANGGDVNVTENGAPPSESLQFVTCSSCFADSFAGAGIVAAAVGGQGGNGESDGYSAGSGGAAVPKSSGGISLTDANVSTSGTGLPGLWAYSQGGQGGQGATDNGGSTIDAGLSNGGAGGNAGLEAVSVSAQNYSVKVSTTGAYAPAIVVEEIGGDGGSVSTVSYPDHWTMGSGGNAGRTYTLGTQLVNITGANGHLVQLITNGSNSPGIFALSQGGTGGQGGSTAPTYGYNGGKIVAGDGGDGGEAAPAMVSVESGVINTTGALSPGIDVQSEGGAGGDGGDATGETGPYSTTGGTGGAGGNSGQVTVETDSRSSVTTQGGESPGIFAQSASGEGANGGKGKTGGSGTSSGISYGVSLTNAGTIDTSGQISDGIIAQAMAGNGGDGGISGGFFVDGANGAASGPIYPVVVTNSGSISTAGDGSHGILAQSIGGGGGNGGDAYGLGAVGGNAGTGFTSNGGTVDITTAGGSIQTSGTSSYGVLAQSIGGGGGDGGYTTGAVTIGGTGGGGGGGGTVNATLNGGSISTSGDYSNGLLMQSIGGGGGNGGNADAISLFASVALGGTGGQGGDGGNVTFNSMPGTEITTSGTKSAGLVEQSIGGGGGDGGNAYAWSLGAGGAAAMAVGGKGVSAGDGGTAKATLVGTTIETGMDPLLINGALQAGQQSGSGCTALPCTTLPVDSDGVVIQSIGGGGGNGGSASAKAIAIAVPIDAVTSFDMATSVAIGGQGGGGGKGGLAEFSLSKGSNITTSGQGAIGVLLQSIGGGGGNGGDASASAQSYGAQFIAGKSGALPANMKQVNIDVTVSLGGEGGQGGGGGEVDAVLGGTWDAGQDPSDSPRTSVVTYGDYADALLAQSIGGGGGNGGFGSGSTQTVGQGNSYKFNVTVGGTGGLGGNGGNVIVRDYSGSGITTYGSDAIGIEAESVGGGGGNSQGIGVTYSLPTQDFLSKNLPSSTKVSVGLGGGIGGVGGNVDVIADGSITTHGGDATGILAQSVGGGGGVGGSAGSDASADNPIVLADNARKATESVITAIKDVTGNLKIPWKRTSALAIGGTGGTGGNAGTVTVRSTGPITTSGDWADGIVAQSVGGGGGMGGTAVATGSGGTTPAITVNFDLAVGGTGGSAGVGGMAAVTLDGDSITTSGYAANGVVAQSIGGGGGLGGDGSDSGTGVLSVGGAKAGNGGIGSYGSTANLVYNNATIGTSGDASDGIEAQSIGGGGGTAGAGSSFFVASSRAINGEFLNLSAGGGQGPGGAGGMVTIEPSGSQINIRTTGNDAFGILAQSIGGGGGNVIAQNTTDSIEQTVGGGNGNAGPVTVTLDSNSQIFTSGIAAHGIVAQSIGGGGGVLRVVHESGDSPGLESSMAQFVAGNGRPKQVGNGNTVTVEDDGYIGVLGAGAVGILAQSIGAGGGLVNNGIDGAIHAGTTGSAVYGDAGSGGTVNVTVSQGQVSSAGVNGIGIFAQSAGTRTGGSTANVTILGVPYNNTQGLVLGGIGNGATYAAPGSAGVVIDTPAGTVGNVNLDNGNQGSQAMISSQCISHLEQYSNCTAILASGGGSVNVMSSGRIFGDMYLNGGTGSTANVVSATAASGVRATFVNNGFFSGSLVDANVLNSGAIALVSPMTGAPTTTTITGDFSQTSSGQLNVAIDSLNKKAGQLQVDGNASIAGRVVPTAISLLPGNIQVVTAGKSLSIDPTAIAQSSTLFDWQLATSGNAVTLSPTLHALPNGLALTPTETAFADYLTRLWNNAEAKFATEFAALSGIDDGGEYKNLLDTLAGKVMFGQSKAFATSTGTMLGSSMSCPVFVTSGVQLGEDSCFWSKLTGGHASEWGEGDVGSSEQNSVTTRIGMQYKVAPDWYVGGSFGANQTWSTSSDGSSGSGQAYDGSVAIKHVDGPWYLAGSLAFGSGEFESNREIDLPFLKTTLQGNPNIFFAGARFRAGYEFGFNHWYVRPYNDIDLVYTHIPGFQESNASINAIDVNGSDKTSVVFSPMVEVGGRWDLDDKTTIRPFAAVGASFRPSNAYSFDVSLAGASAASGTFRESFTVPSAQLNMDLGLQIYRASGIDVKAEYDLETGHSFRNQGGSLRIAHSF
jgi:uncharacterized protein YhjY with autotransporter beta-barrel domain